LPWV